MRISKQTHRLVDIGPLDHALRLPTASRVLHAMKTICRACREPVTDEYFIAGFKAGENHMILHESCCADEPAVKRLGAPNPFPQIDCPCGETWTQELHTVCPRCARWPTKDKS
jgi:hypothetical protein